MSEEEIVAVAVWKAEWAIRIFEPSKDLNSFKGPISEPSINPKIQRHFVWLDPNDDKRMVMGVWIMADSRAEAHGGGLLE